MQCRVVAFEDRQGGFIFVKVPDEYGRYVRTSHHVAISACPACASDVGVPCRGQYGRYTGSIHADRMTVSNRTIYENFGRRSRGRCGGTDVLYDDVIIPVSLPRTGVWMWGT